MQTHGSTGNQTFRAPIMEKQPLLSVPLRNATNICVLTQRGGPENWLHHAEHPVHAHREQGDCYRRGADGEQAKRKCLH